MGTGTRFEMAEAEAAVPQQECEQDHEPELEVTAENEADTMAKAKAAIKSKSYDEAINFFAAVLKYKVEQSGELGAETAPLYYDYGDAVLRKAESSMDLFGGGGDGEAAPADQQTEGDDDDLEIAWMNLEVAAKIYRECEGKGLELARVLLRLGDVSQASDNFEKSVADYTECLELRERYCKPHDRRLADAQYSLAMAHGFLGQTEKHLEHMKASVQCMERCAARLELDIKSLKAGNEDEEGRTLEFLESECKEIKEILVELQEDVADEGLSAQAVPALKPEPLQQASKNPFEQPSTPAAAGPVKVLEARSKRKAPDASTETTGTANKVQCNSTNIATRAPAAAKASIDKLEARLGPNSSAGTTTVGFGTTTIGF